jgi:hypothetical protein
MTESTPGGWGSCPEGELTRLSAALAFQRRLKLAAVAGVVLLAGAGVAGAGWLAHSALQTETPQPECAPCHTEPTPCGSEPTIPTAPPVEPK